MGKWIYRKMQTLRFLWVQMLTSITCDGHTIRYKIAGITVAKEKLKSKG